MQRKITKDPMWWVHPDMKNKVLDFDGLLEFPSGSVEFIRDGAASTALPVSIEEGEFSSLASLLFMINGHRPGPIRGFYVVVEAAKGRTWCVGQIHADAATPLRVFVDALYSSEADARLAAEKMRLKEWGNAPPRMS